MRCPYSFWFARNKAAIFNKFQKHITFTDMLELGQTQWSAHARLQTGRDYPCWKLVSLKIAQQRSLKICPFKIQIKSTLGDGLVKNFTQTLSVRVIFFNILSACCVLQNNFVLIIFFFFFYKELYLVFPEPDHNHGVTTMVILLLNHINLQFDSKPIFNLTTSYNTL